MDGPDICSPYFKQEHLSKGCVFKNSDLPFVFRENVDIFDKGNRVYREKGSVDEPPVCGDSACWKVEPVVIGRAEPSENQRAIFVFFCQRIVFKEGLKRELL